MDARRAAAMAERGKDGRVRVFDWGQAAMIIAERGVSDAGACLAPDSRSTWWPILSDGEPGPDRLHLVGFRLGDPYAGDQRGARRSLLALAG